MMLGEQIQIEELVERHVDTFGKRIGPQVQFLPLIHIAEPLDILAFHVGEQTLKRSAQRPGIIFLHLFDNAQRTRSIALERKAQRIGKGKGAGVARRIFHAIERLEPISRLIHKAGGNACPYGSPAQKRIIRKSIGLLGENIGEQVVIFGVHLQACRTTDGAHDVKGVACGNDVLRLLLTIAPGTKPATCPTGELENLVAVPLEKLIKQIAAHIGIAMKRTIVTIEVNE